MLRITRVSRALKAMVYMTIAFVFMGWVWHVYQYSFAGASSGIVTSGQWFFDRHTLGSGPRLVMLAPRDLSIVAPIARMLSVRFTVDVLQPREVFQVRHPSLEAISAALQGEHPRAWILVDPAAEQPVLDLSDQDVLWLFHSDIPRADWHTYVPSNGGRLGVVHHYRGTDSSPTAALRHSGWLSYEAVIERCVDSIGTACAELDARHIAAFAATRTAQAFIGAEFSDRLAQGGEGPAMRVVPAGSYIRGDARFWSNAEAQPRHRVDIDRPLAISRTEVTVSQYRAFVRATGEAAGNGCGHHDVDEVWRMYPERNWQQPGFPQDDTYPVVCVHWPDAQRYVQWLSAQTGAHYRLPTEDELEYLIRAGRTGDYGANSVSPGTICQQMNGADQSLAVSYRNRACSDGHTYTAPVGSYPANDFGLHDMHGNVWEWTQDCSGVFNRGWGQWILQVIVAPSPRIRERCNYRVTRGGAWLSSPQFLKAHTRREVAWDTPLTTVGIRLVREIAPHMEP